VLWISLTFGYFFITQFFVLWLFTSMPSQSHQNTLSLAFFHTPVFTELLLSSIISRPTYVNLLASDVPHHIVEFTRIGRLNNLILDNVLLDCLSYRTPSFILPKSEVHRVIEISKPIFIVVVVVIVVIIIIVFRAFIVILF